MSEAVEVPPPTPAPDPTPRPGRGRRAAGGGVAYVVPALLVLAVLTVWPAGRLLWTSLHRSSVSAPADDSFVGLANYGDVLSSRTWWLAVLATLGLVVVCVGLQLLLGALFAATLRRITIVRAHTRMLVLVPFALLGVTTASIWREALVNGFAPDWFGYDGATPGAAIAAVVASEVWRGTGVTTLILLAGLETIPSRLRDATVADGASPRQVLLRLVLPATAPFVAVAVVYRALDTLRAFEAPLLAQTSTALTSTDRGSADQLTLMTLLWDTSVVRLESGLAATIAVLTLVVAGLLGAALAFGLRLRRVV